MEECPYCGSRSVREYDDRCPACQEHVGYPNVRRASRQDEQSALDARLRAAREEAQRRGTEAVFDEFLTAASSAQAVMCRSLSDTMSLVESDNQMYVPFYRQVAGGSRRPEATQTDTDRTVADQRLFPYYADHICFAALSLDGLGPTHYGGLLAYAEDSDD